LEKPLVEEKDTEGTLAVENVKKTLDFDELTEKLTELEEKQKCESTPDEKMEIESPAEQEKVELPTEQVEEVKLPVDLEQPTVEQEVVKDPAVEIAPTETAEVCLTPSEAVPEKIFAVPAVPNESNKYCAQESVEEDFHLYFDDSEDPAEPLAEEEPTKKFDLQKLFDTYASSEEEETKEKSPEKAKKVTPKKAETRAEFMAKLRNSKPVTLQGRSSDIIDLTNPEETGPNGVEQLMKRFIRHATAGKKRSLDPNHEGILSSIKAGEKFDDSVDLISKPGTKMSKFKSELQMSIAKQRVEEFNQRQKEYKMYEDETDELLGNGKNYNFILYVGLA